MEVVEIYSLDHQGRGIGKVNNKIIFVPNTLPQEKVEVEITKEKKNFLEGKLLHILEKSPDRIDSLCPYYPTCGGCQLLHLPYLKQLEYKEEKVKNILSRYHVDIPFQSIVGSPKQFHYRNKVTFQNENHELGFYEENSYHFLKIENCLLLEDKINQEIIKLPKDRGKLIVRSNDTEVTFEPNQKIMHTIGDFSFQVSLESFFQVNDSVTLLLYQKVKEYLQGSKEDTVLDLYCGTGTIGIFVSQEVKKVIGIEKNEEAIRNAKENAKINHVQNIEFRCGDAGLETAKLAKEITKVIIDPPRSGLNEQTIKTLIQLAPDKIVYVSCDPMTLVRDLNILKEYYLLEEITPFDMFPNTYHVENVVSLKKLGS